MFCHMKDMGRYGNTAFCALILYYCSVIAAAQVTSSPPAYERRGDGASDVSMTSSLSGDQTQFFTNHTNLNSTESEADSAAGMVTNSSAPTENISSLENITAGLNVSDRSPVINETRVTMVTLTTLLPPATHDPRSEIRNTTFHPTPTAVGITTPPGVSSPGSTATPTGRESSPATTAAVTTVTAQTATSSSPMHAKARVDTPSALNVGDEDINPKVPSDPLLAGLVSAFVVIAALVSVLIFLKFRNRSEGPEFSRLQDVPMDDMLEDAPLSMYSY